MIEDEKLGLKIAENPKEAMWYNVVKGIKADIETSENTLEVSKEFLKVAEKKLDEFPKHKKEVKKPVGGG